MDWKALLYLWNLSLEFHEEMAGDFAIWGLQKKDVSLAFLLAVSQPLSLKCSQYLFFSPSSIPTLGNCTRVLKRRFWFLHLSGDGGLPLPRSARLWGWSLWVAWPACCWVQWYFCSYPAILRFLRQHTSQPLWHPGWGWTAGLLAMLCFSNRDNSWRKHFLGGLSGLPAFFPQVDRSQYWPFEMSMTPEFHRTLARGGTLESEEAYSNDG